MCRPSFVAAVWLEFSVAADGGLLVEMVEELISCRTNERTNEHYMAYSNSAKRDCVSPKNPSRADAA